MKLADIKVGATYYGTYATNKGLSTMKAYKVIGVGKYAQVIGECGTMVVEMPESGLGGRVAVEFPHPTLKGKVIQQALNPGVLVYSAEDYHKLVKLQEEDKARHEAARKEVQERRVEARKEVLTALGLPEVLWPHVRLGAGTNWDGKGRARPYLSLSITVGGVGRVLNGEDPVLTPEAMAALDRYHAIKDPTC